MKRVASRPLNKAAVTAANAAIAPAHPVPPKPGEPGYTAFCKAWMDAYVAAGGAYEAPDDTERAKRRIEEARKAGAEAGQRGTVAPCPETKSTEPPPPPPAKPNPDCPCQLTAVTVTCSHGRTAKDNLLMVVPGSVGGDDITVIPQAGGDCETRLTISGGGKQTKGIQPHQFTAYDPSALATVYKLWAVAPTVNLVTANACAVQLETVRVEAYPHVAISLVLQDKSKIIEKIMNAFQKLPTKDKKKESTNDNDKGPAPIKEIGKKESWEKKKFGLSLSLSAGWEEDKATNLAYCHYALTGGVDPLFGVEGEFLVYGVPIPPKISKFIKAGIYLYIYATSSLNADCSWDYWPHEKYWKWSKCELALSGEGSIKLAAELLVATKDVVAVSAGGQSAISLKGWGEKANGSSPTLNFNATFDPLTVSLVLRFAWGLVEYEKSWKLFETIEYNTEPWAPFS